MDPLKSIVCAILFASLISSCEYFVKFSGFWANNLLLDSDSQYHCYWISCVLVWFHWWSYFREITNDLIVFFLIIRHRAGMLRVFKSNGKHWKVFEYNQNMWTRWGCLSHRNSMGKSAVLHSRRPQTVLRLETVFHEETVHNDSSKVHALLHTHLVWGLDLLRVLPGRQV